MDTYTLPKKQSESQTFVHQNSQRQTNSKSTFQFVDNRPEAVFQRKLQEGIKNSSQAQNAAYFQEIANNYTAQNQSFIQKKENKTSSTHNLFERKNNLGLNSDIVQRVIRIENPNEEYTKDSTAEIKEQYAQEIDDNLLQYILDFQDHQERTYPNIAALNTELTQRKELYNNLLNHYREKMLELNLERAPEADEIPKIIAGRITPITIEAAREQLNARLIRLQAARNMRNEVNEYLDTVEENELDGVTNANPNKKEAIRSTTLMFTWLYQKATTFTQGIRQRAATQIREIREQFNVEDGVYENAGAAINADFLSAFIDSEIMEAIRRELPTAQDANIIWPTVEHGTNVLYVDEDNEDVALNQIEGELQNWLERGYNFIRQGLDLGEADRRIRFANSLIPEECYPGRIANVETGVLPPPPPPGLLQQIQGNVAPNRPEELPIIAAYTLAQEFQDEDNPQPENVDTANYDHFVEYVGGLLQGELAPLNLNINFLGAQNVQNMIRYMFT